MLGCSFSSVPFPEDYQHSSDCFLSPRQISLSFGLPLAPLGERGSGGEGVEVNSHATSRVTVTPRCLDEHQHSSETRQKSSSKIPKSHPHHRLSILLLTKLPIRVR
jgi:hypothetical protein